MYVYLCVCAHVRVCMGVWVHVRVCVYGGEASLKILNCKGKEAERHPAPVRKPFSQGQDILEMK